MSGIVGLLQTDGTPVDPGLIRSLTSALAPRGPDRQETWCDEHVAFGHALLRTTHESKNERQPFSLDGETWIVADGRVDARADLIGALAGADANTSERWCDVELILRAYHRWGEECVEHLLGDFAFAIWDGTKRRLFCARDHMGVKPFYYAHIGRWLLFSSSIESIRLHREVSETLNDLAIADFLLFGGNQDQSTTSFRDIQRLPPAHILTWDRTGLAVKRYWTLPIEEPVYYRKDRDYIDQFNELVHRAVSDRLRTDRVGVFMSGGLDSTALAATASDLLRCRAVANPVRAFTFVYDSLFEDSEREYAGRVARHLKIPIHYYALDARDNGVPSDTTRMPEPVQTSPDYETELSCYAAMSTHSRVAFYGEGPDNALLYEWRPHLTYLLRNRRFARLTADLVKHVVSHKRVPLLPTIPRMLRDRKFQKQHEAPFPEWLAPDLVHRLQLRRRWQDLENVSDSPHPTRPRGYASLLTAQWQSIFETNEPSYTGVALEVRHPFVDIRLLRFLLRIPAVPWCRSKYLLRRALRGIIPEAVRRRPKTPLSSNPDYELFRRCGLPAVRPSALLTRYRNTRAQLESDSATIPAISAGFRFVALSYWLSDSQSVRIRQEEEKGHGLAATLASFAGG